jgi:hypothetical protein
MRGNAWQEVLLAAEMRDHGFARGSPRNMFQKCRSDVHVFEAAAPVLRFPDAKNPAMPLHPRQDHPLPHTR